MTVQLRKSHAKAGQVVLHLVKSGELNVHPVAARQVDFKMLRKLAGAGAPAKSA